MSLENPINRAIIVSAKSILNLTNFSSNKAINQNLHKMNSSLTFCQAGGCNHQFVRLAGLSGSLAVLVAIYGKSIINNIVDPKRKSESVLIFEKANRFHFLHTLAILASPFSRIPILSGSLMLTGIILFSGSTYYRALTGNNSLLNLATYGGFCLCAAWLSLLL